MKFTWKEDGRRIILIVVAAAISAVNIKSFVRTGGLYPGGVTGLTLLIQRACEMFFGWEIPYTLVACLLNFGPLYIGYRYLGKKFTLYSCLSILVTSILTDILPSVPITSDILLICIFGGIINGDGDQYLSASERHHRRNGSDLHLSVPEEGCGHLEL